MSGGEKKRDTLLFPFLGLTPQKRHKTLQSGFYLFPGAAAFKENKRPVNMRPATMILIAHLDFMVNMRPATGQSKVNKAMVAKKKEVPAMLRFEAPPKLNPIAGFSKLLFLSAASPFFMAI